MDPPIPIRPAVMADYDSLCALWEELDEHHRRVRPDLFRTPEGPRRERAWAQALIEGEDSDILVVEAMPAGLAGLAVVRIDQHPEAPVRISSRFVQIDNLVVASTTRRRGVGTALIGACADWAAAHGVELLELKMQEFNEGARRFYERMGFVTARRWMSLRLHPAASPAVLCLGAEESPC